MNPKEKQVFCQWLVKNCLLNAKHYDQAMSGTQADHVQLLIDLQKLSCIQNPRKIWEKYQRWCKVQAMQRPSPPDSYRVASHALTVDVPIGGQVAVDTSLDRDGVPRQIGRFKITKELGRGGMGVVYEGYDSALDRKVAIKLILSESPQGPTENQLADFVTEAKVMASVNHGNVIVLYDGGLHGACPYIAMQYVDGWTLDKACLSGITDQEKLELFAKVVDGVAACHEAGFIHRDLKPDNIIVDRSYRALVMDLGLALTKGQLVDPDMLAGTPSYLSPEQAMSLPDLAPSSDVYTLGRIVLRMLYVRTEGSKDGLIHQSTSLAKLLFDVAQEASTSGPPPKIREMMEGAYPEELIVIVEKCLHPVPEKRYQDAGDLSKAMSGFFDWQKQQKNLAEEKMQQRARDQARELGLEKEASKRFKVAGVISLLMLLSVLGLSLWGAHQAVTAEEEATEKVAALEREKETQKELDAVQAKREADLIQKGALSQRLIQAQALMENSKWKQAEVELSAIVEANPDFLPALWPYAQVLFNRLDRRSCGVYKRIAELTEKPDDKARAQFWCVYNGLDQGVISAEEATSLHDSMPEGMYKSLADAYICIIYRERSWKKQSKAKAQYVVSQNLMRGEEARLSLELYHSLASETQRLEKKALDKLGKIQDKHWVVDWLYGYLLNKSNPVLAEAHLTRSINVNTKFPMAWYWRAALYNESLADPKSAIRDAERLHVLLPGWPKGELMRANSYVTLARQNIQKKDVALGHFDSALEILDSWEDWVEINGDLYQVNGGSIETHRALVHRNKMAVYSNHGEPAKLAQERRFVEASLEKIRQIGGEGLKNLTPKVLADYNMIRGSLQR